MKRAADDDLYERGFHYGKEIPGQGFEIYEYPNIDNSNFKYGLVPSMSRVHVFS